MCIFAVYVNCLLFTRPGYKYYIHYKYTTFKISYIMVYILNDVALKVRQRYIIRMYIRVLVHTYILYIIMYIRTYICMSYPMKTVGLHSDHYGSSISRNVLL